VEVYLDEIERNKSNPNSNMTGEEVGSKIHSSNPIFGIPKEKQGQPIGIGAFAILCGLAVITF